MWINKETNEIIENPRALANALGVDHPGRAMRELMNSDKFERVSAGPKPEFDPATQRLRKTAPVLVDGVWTISWEVVDRDQAEVQEEITAKRNRRIAAVNEKLEKTLMKRMLNAARNQFPAVVAKAQQKIDAINASNQPDSVDIDDID